MNTTTSDQEGLVRDEQSLTELNVSPNRTHLPKFWEEDPRRQYIATTRGTEIVVD